uniref:Ig-like domain-containing protein n=1 Tax=Capra hircus TaxID=9925 RepID=A0A8C2NP26_CAPHI
MKPPTKAEEARAPPPPPPPPHTHPQSIHLDPDSTMGFRQLCCVVLCLLGIAVSADPGITQIPKYLVMGTTDKKSLKCEQHLGHNAMYWYKQSAQKLPELMFIHNYRKLNGNESVPSRFWPECPDSSQCRLDLSAPKPQDSAVYLCASSRDTALQSQFLPVHKPPGSRQEAVGAIQVLDWHFPSDHSPACGVTWHGSGEFLHRHQQCMPGSSKEKD